MRNPVIVALCVLWASAPVAAEESMVITVKRLSTDTALAIARGAIEACREQGIQIAATVVDRDGTVQVTLRDTIAAPITVPISEMKAKTAVNFNSATSALKERADTPIGRIDGLVMSAGGVPVLVGGSSLVAGVGVSGAPAGETDEECAQAGVAKVQEDLDMGM